MSTLETTILDDLTHLGDLMRRDLSAHVAIPTKTGFQPGIDQYRRLLVDRLEDLGATAVHHLGDPRPDWLDENPRPAGINPPETVILHHESDTPGPRILIAGHLDTVHDPDGEFNELIFSPDNKTATGPGAADMKGGILIALYAIEALHRANVTLNWSFLLNADEETGSFHSNAALREEAGTHDFGLAVEPALPDGALALERMGSGQFMVEIFGKSAHVGREFTKGVSAVTKLGEVLTTLGQLPKPEDGMIVNVGPLRGGRVANAVPDYAACWGNVRFQDEEAAQTLARSIEALATDENTGLPRVVVHQAWNRPAKPALDATRQLADLATQTAHDLGQSISLVSTGGVCDGNILQDAGLPTIDTLGVRGGGLHTTKEWIEVDSLVERAQLFALLLLRLAKIEA